MIDDTAQKMNFSIKDFFSKCNQIRNKLGIWSHLLKKTLMKNFIFRAVWVPVRYWSYPQLQVWLRNIKAMCHFRKVVLMKVIITLPYFLIIVALCNTSPTL